MAVVSLFDIVGIQSFVFASNRLRDVVSGSYLVDYAFGDEAWVRRQGVTAESVIAAEGGNLMLRFESLGQARSFTGLLSRRLMDHAPGLEMVAQHLEHGDGELRRAILDVRRAVEAEKLQRTPSAPTLGLGVTASCRETRLPARTVLDDGTPASALVEARRRSWDAAEERWADLLDGLRPPGPSSELGFVFPRELDHLGRSHGESSLIGVVHIDGNGLGSRITSWLRSGTASDTELAQSYRELSATILDSFRRALRSAAERVVSAVAYRDGAHHLESKRSGQSFRLRVKGREVSLPIRPLILAGDDLTFVCDGRVALDLAAFVVQRLAETSVPLIGPLASCAGVAFVKSHAPFSRAYGRAIELCRFAKSFVRKQPEAVGFVDWQIGLSSPTMSVEQLRDGGDARTCRPYPLKAVANAPSLEWLRRHLLGTEDSGLRSPMWTAHRSKLQQLRHALPKGDKEVRTLMDSWQLTAGDLALPNDIMKDGYVGDRTPLLDALELLDLDFDLEGR